MGTNCLEFQEVFCAEPPLMTVRLKRNGAKGLHAELFMNGPGWRRVSPKSHRRFRRRKTRIIIFV